MESFCAIRAVGALSSFLAPSAGLRSVFSGDDEDAVITDDAGGRVFSRMGTNALRTSSAADSLPHSLGLLGGVLDGLFGMAAGVVVAVVVFAGSVVYSVGYFTGSKEYGGRTVGGKVGRNRSADDIGMVPEEAEKQSASIREAAAILEEALVGEGRLSRIVVA